ncbi:hypothetical protein Tco_0857807 [Tanacetum coccineum]|uniref:F-box domain-containing protein n=1 Tax=Tanacetum coccineum TaxID=301880 RepID=A0ABQ5B7M4_9ASTR
MASSACSSTQNPPKKAPNVTYIDLTSDEASPQQHHATIDTTLALIIPPPIPHADTQVYGAIIPKAMTTQALLDSVAYKTYYAIASGAKPPKSRKSQKKSDSTISFEESPFKKKSAKAKKVADAKPKPTKKKAPVKADKGKGDGTDFESGVPDEQRRKTSGTDEGTGDSREEEDDDENDCEDENDDDGNDGDGDDDDDNQEDDVMYDNDEETDNDRTESDRIKIPVLNQSSTEYYEEEEEKIDDEEEDDEVTKELYNDVNVNLGNKDADMTDADQANNEIASLMDTTVRHEEPRSQTSSLYIVPVTTTPNVTSVFTITIPPPPPLFNHLPQQETPTPTPTTSKATTLFPSLPYFLSVFKFNDRVTNLEKDLSEIKQVKQYAQALSSIPAIVDRYINNKLGEAIQKAIVAHNLDFREEAQAEKRDYIELKYVTKSLEATVLARSSSQPKSTYEAAASLSEFELTKILIDKMEKNKSYNKVEYKRELYDALVKSYQTDKDLFDTYGEVKGKKSSSTSKVAFHSQHKHSGKSAHAVEPSHTVDDSGVQQYQEFNTGNNDEQPADKVFSKADCQVSHAKEPTTSFDELLNTPIDFSAFVLNRLNMKELTQAILVGPAFKLLKGKPYPFDLNKPLPLIRDHRGRQVIPQDFFINKDLEYLKGGDLSKRYSTFVTKIKAATYEIKLIEDLVQNVWSLVKVIYDKHTYWGTSHWGPKRQLFYGFAANMSSSREVYSRKRIIVILSPNTLYII